ncbi:hypothetical protein [Leptolyngbya sp. FACHB-261]|uniref:hypothetical protein n=1 Tax=Leptolyngbya sp. FACHB-261 TaxID=2692806 RepID=UPI001683DA5A|nr:hypothetical protein [Leptolyngbya sp. FACHB-261]MBD2104737.1 hypothetical protein [Leptolyngbya sp. FACHB-261]
MQKSLLSIAALTSVLVTQVLINSAQAAETIYKLRLRDAATGNVQQGSVFSPGDLDREEWVVVTVIDNRRIRVRHATSVQNKFLPTRTWFDHPATAIRVCVAEEFDNRNCQSAQGDTVDIPTGRSIHDVAIDFRYSEAGSLYTRAVQITPDIRPSR